MKKLVECQKCFLKRNPETSFELDERFEEEHTFIPFQADLTGDVELIIEEKDGVKTLTIIE